MSRTDIDAATFAAYLRQMCGDGSVEWSYEPMQTSVLLDVADMLDEDAKLRELVWDVYKAAHMLCEAWDGSCSKDADGMSLHSVCPIGDTSELCVFGKLDDRMRELGVEVDDAS